MPINGHEWPLNGYDGFVGTVSRDLVGDVKATPGSSDDISRLFSHFAGRAKSICEHLGSLLDHFGVS